jgi:LysM repeat protein
MWKPIFLTLFLLACTCLIAQAQNETCPEIVQQALAPVGELCNALDRNAACYGATMVDSTTFADPRPANFFLAPGDHADLALLREIHPRPLDEASQTFGVALLNVQADVPNALPGQSVIFMLVGDARLTNDVPPDSTRATPFQSFYFMPGVGQAECYEAEPMLTIQTPGNITITITLNGVETQMSPGTLLTITPEVCTIHRGNIVQGEGTLLTNQTVDIRIEPTGRVVVTRLRDINEAEYQRGLQVQEVLNALAVANEWPEQVIAPLPAGFGEEPAATEEPSPCAVQYTVQSGDTLHRIATRFDTSVLGIAEANQLADPRRIYVGQTLCIPNPGSGFQALPAGQ